MKNLFIIGAADKSDFILSHLDLSEPTLIVDDGPLIDALTVPPRRKVTVLDWTRHQLNPLQGIDYLRACDILSVFQAVFPAGQSTLTKEGAWDWLLEALLAASKGDRLDTLFQAKFDDPGYISAQRMVRRLMRSPLLKRVLCAPTNFPMDGVVLARINRAQLGDFDSFVLSNVLIGQFPGQVVVVDGGFHLRDHHTTLIWQNRLLLSINFLDELTPKLREAALTIKDKVAYRTTPKDADLLTFYFPRIWDPDILANQEDGEYRISWGG